MFVVDTLAGSVSEGGKSDKGDGKRADAVPTPVDPGDGCQRRAGGRAGEVDRHIDGVRPAAGGRDETEDAGLVGDLTHLGAEVENDDADGQRDEV